MKKNFLLQLLLCGLTVPFASGQSVLVPEQNNYETAKGIVYNKEFSVNFKLHTNGFSIGADFGTLKTYYLTRFWGFEIGEIKHPKEFRQSFDFRNPITSKVARAFVFGKQNNFYPIRISFGEKRYFSEKASRKGLAIGGSYAVGPSLGLLKPYYLELVRFIEPGSNQVVVRSERYSTENEDVFLDINSIYGSAGFTKGFDGIEILPGANAKLAIHFDWGAFDEFVKALDAGVMVDFYFRKVPIMVESERLDNTENSPIFINLFLNLQLGKRW